MTAASGPTVSEAEKPLDFLTVRHFEAERAASAGYRASGLARGVRIEYAWRARFSGLLAAWSGAWLVLMVVGLAGIPRLVLEGKAHVMAVLLLITVGVALLFVRQLRFFCGRTLVVRDGDRIEVTAEWLRRRSVRRVPLADVRSFEVKRWQTGILYGSPTYAWDVDAVLEGDTGARWSIVEGLPTLEHANRIARELRDASERRRPTDPASA